MPAFVYTLHTMDHMEDNIYLYKTSKRCSMNYYSNRGNKHYAFKKYNLSLADLCDLFIIFLHDIDKELTGVSHGHSERLSAR